MRIMFLAMVLGTALASDLGAQGTREYSLIFGRRISRADLATAIQNCNKAVLRPPCEEIVRKAEELFPSFGKGNVQLADYIRTLEEKTCPRGAYIRQTEWIPASQVSTQVGRLVLASHTMDCTSQEVLLWDKSANKPVLSLYDGNFVESYTGPSVHSAAQTSSAGNQQSGASVRKPGSNSRTATRTTTSEQRINTAALGKDKEVRRVDTLWRTTVVYDTVTLTNVVTKEVLRVDTVWKSRDFPWKKALLWTGGVLASGGIATAIYCHIEGCGVDTRVSSTNVNRNSGLRVSIPLRSP